MGCAFKNDWFNADGLKERKLGCTFKNDWFNAEKMFVMKQIKDTWNLTLVCL